MKFLLARIFGKKIVHVDPGCGKDLGCKITVRYYKNVMYIIRIRYDL